MLKGVPCEMRKIGLKVLVITLKFARVPRATLLHEVAPEIEPTAPKGEVSYTIPKIAWSCWDQQL